jgi:hypothetical protein
VSKVVVAFELRITGELIHLSDAGLDAPVSG